MALTEHLPSFLFHNDLSMNKIWSMNLENSQLSWIESASGPLQYGELADFRLSKKIQQEMKSPRLTNTAKKTRMYFILLKKILSTIKDFPSCTRSICQSMSKDKCDKSSWKR